MTRKQRVIDALNFIQTEQVPCNVFLTGQAQDILNDAFPGADIDEMLNNHIQMVIYDGFLHSTTEPEIFIDDFGVRWDRSGADKDIGVVCEYAINSPEDYDNYKLPEINTEKLHKLFSNDKEEESDKFKFGAIGFTLFERAWSLCGMENLLADMILEEERVHSLLDKICEYNLKVLDIALEYEWDGFHFGDDWGQQKGLIMGPGLWRKFIKPRMEKLYAKVTQKGLWVSQHSCGDLRDVLDDLVEIGLNVYNTVQPEIYNLTELKQKYDKKLAFWGCISTQRDLATKTPEEINVITHETLGIMSLGGGYIAAPTHAVEFDVPVENLISMANVFNKEYKNKII